MITASTIELLGWGFSDCFFSIFANNLLNNFFYVGVLYSAIATVNLIFTVVTSKMLSEISARMMAVLARLLYTVCVLMYFFAGFFYSIIPLFFAVLFNGIGRAMRNTSEQDFLIEHSNNKNASTIMGTNFALKNTAWYASMAISGFILIWLANLLGKTPENTIHYLFLLVLPCFAIEVFLLKKIHIKKRIFNLFNFKKAIFDSHIFTNFFKGTKNLHPVLIFGISLIFMLRVLRDMILLFVPLLAIKLNLEFWQIGILIGLLHVPFLFSFLFSFVADKVDRLNLIIFGLLFSLFPLVFLSKTSAPLMIGALSSLISFSVAIIQPADLGIIASLAEKKDRAHIAGLELFLGQAGIIFGSIVLGFVAEQFSLQTVFLIMAVISFIFALIAIKIKIQINCQNIGNKHNKVSTEITHHHIVHHAYHANK